MTIFGSFLGHIRAIFETLAIFKSFSSIFEVIFRSFCGRLKFYLSHFEVILPSFLGHF